MTAGSMITEAYRQKVVTAEAAAAALHNGDTVLVSGGASNPGAFLEALSGRPAIFAFTLEPANKISSCAVGSPSPKRPHG